MNDIVLDRSGHLLEGNLFWLFPTSEEQFDGEEKGKGWIVAARTPSEFDLDSGPNRRYMWGNIRTDPDAETKCKISRSHRTKSIYRKPIIDLEGGAKFSEVIPVNSANAVVITELLADRLRQQKFVGFELVEASVGNERRPPRDQRVFAINFLGDCCLRRMRIRSTVPNSCYSCGEGPVLCPECGEIVWKCPKCAKNPAYPSDSPTSKIPGVLRVQPRAQRIPLIIEGHLWDGSDFISGGWMFAGRGIVTRRVINWLLSQHVAPFVAEPLAVDVSKMSAEQLKRLEAVK